MTSKKMLALTGATGLVTGFAAGAAGYAYVSNNRRNKHYDIEVLGPELIEYVRGLEARGYARIPETEIRQRLPPFIPKDVPRFIKAAWHNPAEETLVGVYCIGNNSNRSRPDDVASYGQRVWCANQAAYVLLDEKMRTKYNLAVTAEDRARIHIIHTEDIFLKTQPLNKEFRFTAEFEDFIIKMHVAIARLKFYTEKFDKNDQFAGVIDYCVNLNAK